MQAMSMSSVPNTERIIALYVLPNVEPCCVLNRHILPVIRSALPYPRIKTTGRPIVHVLAFQRIPWFWTHP